MLARLLRAAEGLVRSGTREFDPASISSVLVLEYRLPLGCLVHMTPVFEALKRSRPELPVAVATRGLGLEVLRHSPWIDHLIATPDPTQDLYGAVRSLRRELRAHAFRPGITLTGASDRRTKIALLSLLASRGLRAGFTLAPQLYDYPFDYDETLSHISNNLRLARLLGADAQPARPHVAFSAADQDHAAALLREANPDQRPQVVFVTQNSGGQSTGWHIDRFVQVIRHAASRGCAVAYVGTAADAAPIDAIRQAAGGVGASVAGRTSVSQLAALLAMSDFAVTLDTGTMHVGRAAGLPMVVLGPSWQKPLEWMPLNVENVRILRGPDRPDVPPNYHLDEIEAGQVTAALDELIENYPPTPQDRNQRVEQSLSSVDHRSH